MLSPSSITDIIARFLLYQHRSSMSLTLMILIRLTVRPQLSAANDISDPTCCGQDVCDCCAHCKELRMGRYLSADLANRHPQPLLFVLLLTSTLSYFHIPRSSPSRSTLLLQLRSQHAFHSLPRSRCPCGGARHTHCPGRWSYSLRRRPRRHDTHRHSRPP